MKKFFLTTSVYALVSMLGITLSTPTTQAAFAGDNGKIVFASNRDDANGEIYTMNSDGTNQTRITNSPGTDANPTWSPDGKKIVFLSARDASDGGDFDLFVMNPDGSNVTQLTHTPTYEHDPSWSPDGKKIIFGDYSDYKLYTMNSDGSNRTVFGSVIGGTFATYSPAGDKIAFTATQGTPNAELYTMNADGANITKLVNNGLYSPYPSWSPDGNKIVYMTLSSGSPNYEIFIVNTDGTSNTRLTNAAGPDFRPSFSPDGTKIIFSSDRSGNNEIYTMNPDGSGQTAIFTNLANDGDMSWQSIIGTTVTNSDGSTTTTVAAGDSFPVLDYTVESNETLVLNGQLCDVVVESGGILKGTGTACTITVEPGGTVAPGNSPGCLSSGDLSLAGTFVAELAGTTPCTGYDQLQATGTVTVGGALNVSLLNGFTPAPGNVFTLIDNDATDPVTGSFANLAEGATITLGSSRFTISYVGGTGNDVTLTALVPLPGLPATGVEPNLSSRTASLRSFILF